jgi:hypothetical protein
MLPHANELGWTDQNTQVSLCQVITSHSAAWISLSLYVRQGSNRLVSTGHENIEARHGRQNGSRAGEPRLTIDKLAAAEEKARKSRILAS